MDLLIAVVLFLVPAQIQAPPTSSSLVRICVLPAPDRAFPDFADAAADLINAFQKMKKDLYVVAAEERPDVVITITERSATVPKFALSAAAPGPPSMGAMGPVKSMHITSTLVAAGGDDVEIKGRNQARESAGAWQLVAEDVAKQAQKWIAKHKAQILAKR